MALGGLDVQAPGTTTLAGGTVALGNAAGGGNVVHVAAGATALVTSRMTGDDGLVKTGSGRLTLTGSSTYAGTTVVSAGTLAIGNGSTVGSLSGPVRVDAAGTLLLNRSNTRPMAAAISGSGAMIQSGVGTTVLAAANTFSGSTTVQAGVLRVDHADGLASSPTIVAGGRLEVAPGATMRAPRLRVAGGSLSASTLLVGGTVVGMVAIESGSLAGTPAVSVVAGGTLTLPDARQTFALASLAVDGGRVDIGRSRIDVAPGGVTLADLRADLLAARNGGLWNGTAGIGSSAAASTLSRAVGYHVQASVTTSVAWAAFGDVNLDGQVDSTDISLINMGGFFNSGRTDAHWYLGDFNYDGLVNSTDITLLNTSGLFGSGLYASTLGAGGLLALGSFGGEGLPLEQPSVAGFATVPEPSGGFLAALGAVVAALASRLARGRERVSIDGVSSCRS
ncbi:MAG: autotransporter-associated beta strand repeat-containing protein [Planctomycetaceae bacterium]